MTRIIADISVSSTASSPGLNPGLDNGLGDGGDALHTWAFSDDPEDRRIVSQATTRSGAVVLGRRLFDVVDGPGGWNDEVGYGAGEVGKPPFVVVHELDHRSPVRLTDLDWTFVTTGLADAVAAARERAEAASSDRGQDLDVVLMGGGATVGSALVAGLVDTLSLHLAARRPGPVRRCSPAGVAHARAAERDRDDDGDPSDLRRPSELRGAWLASSRHRCAAASAPRCSIGSSTRSFGEWIRSVGSPAPRKSSGAPS